jgi:autotransporter-associated beta strand protein
MASSGTNLAGLITLTGNARISHRRNSADTSAAGPPFVPNENQFGTISGRITGNFSLEFGGFGSDSGGTVVLTNPLNDWGGNTVIRENQRVRLGASEVIPHGPAAGNVIFQGVGDGDREVVLALNGRNETVNGIQRTGGASARALIANGSATPATITIGANDATSTWDGSVRDADPFSAAGSGTGALSLTKTGAGTLTLNGTNLTYSGATSVGGGVLVLGGAVPNSSAANVNAGTLRLGAADRLPDAALVTFGSGTLDTNGFSEAAGVLGLAGAANIDLGAAASILGFADSSGAGWSGGLSVLNWSGLATGDGVDQLLFGTSNSGLTPGQLALIQFVDPFGPGSGAYTATILGDGEVVPGSPVPEPTGLALLAAGAAALVVRRRKTSI